MRYEKPPAEDQQTVVTDVVLSVCPTGVLESTVIFPRSLRARRPLLALHGVSRNPGELVDAFKHAAEKSGRVVVVPNFRAAQWPVFQRVTRRARPDRALLALFATLRGMNPLFDGPMDIFGFSGGAQLAHRFAMLYPEAVGNIHLGAAGWYTLPDAQTPYPYGLAPQQQGQSWCRLMHDGLARYLDRKITVYVGSEDTDRDTSLRANAIVDAAQGQNRFERAQHYVNVVAQQQEKFDLPITARLVVLPGCDHQFTTCAIQSSLADRVCSDS